MKKVFLVFVGAWLLALPGQAQDKRFSIAISGGTGVPFGELGRKDVQDLGANGFAQPGLMFDLSLDYKLGAGSFGLKALFLRQINSFDQEALVDVYRSQNSDATYSVESDDWRINGFFVGGFKTLPISDNVGISLEALLGIIDISRPLITVFADTDFITQNGSGTNSFAYSLGTDISYQFENQLGLFFKMAYLGSQPKFAVEETSSVGFSGNSVFTQGIHSLNVGLGLKVYL